MTNERRYEKDKKIIFGVDDALDNDYEHQCAEPERKSQTTITRNRNCMTRRKLFSQMILLLTAMTAQAQFDFKLYFANNIGELESVAKLKGSNSGLKWKEVTDGMTVGNHTAMVEVRDMFKSSRQKTRQDQETFWKMRATTCCASASTKARTTASMRCA